MLESFISRIYYFLKFNNFLVISHNETYTFFVCFLLQFICYIKHGSLSSRLLNIWILTSNCHWFSCFWFSFIYIFPGGSVGKESACNSGDLGSSPGLRRSPRGEHGNPLQYSSLENPHGQRILACCSPWDHRVRHDWVTKYSTALEPRASQVVLVAKNLPANAGHIRDVGLIPGSGTSAEGGHGTLLLYSSLENPMNRGAWWATVHSISKNQTQLTWLNTHACTRTKAGEQNK